MRALVILSVFVSLVPFANGQKYITKNGYIGIYSKTPLEEIKADNNQVASVLDLKTGDLVIQVLIKSFHFERALMEEHFNENYMDSEKLPRSDFRGKISNLPMVDLSKNDNYDVTVEGEMTIHGVTKKVMIKGSLSIVPGGINASAKFNIVPEDYNITIPGVVREKISKSLEVTVSMKYIPLESKTIK